jgi:hypothetical protein
MAIVWQQWAGLVGVWMLWPVTLLIGLGVVSAWLRSARFKGWLGEYHVRRWLEQDLNPADYRCLHNVTVRLDDGSTTQIDHVVVSRYGMFVLEIKHLQGWIFGSEKQRTWTQTLFKHRSSFQNPLHQNWRHVKALEALLDVPLAHLHSGVVFTADCQFKTPMPAHVTQGRDCTRWVRSFTQVVWSEEDVTRWTQALAQQRLAPTRATHHAHVAHLQARHGSTLKPVEKTQATSEPRTRRAARPSHTALVARKDAMVAAPRTAEVTTPAALTAWEPMEAAVQSAPLSAAPVTQTVAEDVAPSECGACGADLVARSLPDAQGQMRAFWRCMHFPQCRWMCAAEHVTQSVEMHSA